MYLYQLIWMWNNLYRCSIKKPSIYNLTHWDTICKLVIECDHYYKVEITELHIGIKACILITKHQNMPGAYTVSENTPVSDI